MSEEMPDSGAPRTETVAQQVGEMLRATREGRGETITEAALALKLTQRQVEAMESGHFELLPGPAFVRGFLRNYARHLGMDPAAVMAAIEQPAAATTPAVELAPVSNAEGVMPAGSEGGRRTVVPAAVVVAALVVIMFAGWYFNWFEPTAAPEPAVELVPPAPEVQGDGSAPAEQVPAPIQPPPAAEPAVPGPGAEAPGVVAPTTPLSESTAPTPAVPVPQAGEQGSAPAPAAGPEAPQAGAPVPADGAGAAPGVAAGEGRLQFRFDGEAWVEVRDARGRILYSGLSPADSTRTVQGEPPFALVVGNARQVSVQHDGIPVDLAPHIRSNVARLTVK